MQTMSQSMLAQAIQMATESRARSQANRIGQGADRRVATVAIEHEDRRKGPRRWVEKRALMARQNVEND